VLDLAGGIVGVNTILMLTIGLLVSGYEKYNLTLYLSIGLYQVEHLEKI